PTICPSGRCSRRWRRTSAPEPAPLRRSSQRPRPFKSVERGPPYPRKTKTRQGPGKLPPWRVCISLRRGPAPALDQSVRAVSRLSVFERLQLHHPAAVEPALLRRQGDEVAFHAVLQGR